MKVIIYGAQGYALAVYEAYKSIHPDCEVLCFLVSVRGINPLTLGGLPVRVLGEYAPELYDAGKRELKIIIATPEDVQDEIKQSLESYGFSDIKGLSSKEWADLMGIWYEKTGEFKCLSSLSAGDKMPVVHVYRACSPFDRVLKNKPVLSDIYEDVSVDVTKGVNIAEKNGNYSELTVLYWIWKNRLNAADDYYGFAQYRRMLDLTEEDLMRLAEGDVDVVLPYPLLYEPNINAHHERYLKRNDWSALLTALKDIQPEYAEYLSKVLEQRCLYNYNVLLAKGSVLDEYCSWLFPILERIEDLSDPKGCDRSDRYIGYMGETLETLYFMKNSARLRIVHAGCRMYV